MPVLDASSEVEVIEGLEVVKIEPVKREDGPRDLLEVPQDKDIQVEATVAPPALDPVLKFKHKVTNKVKKVLLDYYAKNPADTLDRQGKPKEIKIKTQGEFETYCKKFSKQFQEEITDSYRTFNGTTDGIENVNIGAYNIEHDICEFFS